jgi:GNAT superfamily N-acetyltransferase
MFQAKTMQPSDFQFAAELANTMDWNMAPEDFELNSSLEPDGCFVLYDGTQRLGIATCISYGKIGWFGNLIIDPTNRKKGAGTFLVRHAVKYLQNKGVESIGLYAYPHLAGFYGKIGFTPDIEFSVLHTSHLRSVSSQRLTKITEKNFPKVVAFDADCFGGNRERAIKSIVSVKSNIGFCISNKTDLEGYIVAKVYEGIAEVGPLACLPDHTDLALKLLKAALSNLEGSNVYLYLPRNQKIIQDYLRSVGFQEQFYLTRMFLSRNLSKNCIYIAESLERG